MYRLAFVLLFAPLFLFAVADTEKKDSPAPTLANTTSPLKPIVTGLKNPESACIGMDGRTYVSCIGEFDKDGDGSVIVIDKGKAVPFATGLDDPKGIIALGPNLFVTDKTRVWRIDAKGKATVYVEAKDFPTKPTFLNDIETDGKGTLFVSDSGDGKGKGAIYKIDFRKRVSLLTSSDKNPLLGSCNGLRMVNEYHLHVLNFANGELLRVRLDNAETVKLADGFGGGDGIAYDHYGRLYLSDWKGGKVFGINRPGDKPVLLASGFKSAADICLSRDGKRIIVPDMLGGAVYEIPVGVPGAEVDEKPLAVTLEPAFTDIEWTGWKGVTEKGTTNAQRPIVLTHAGDKSGRVFLATQQGVIHTFKPDAKGAASGKTKVFLDMQSKVRYTDQENEEGFLGLALHPKFATNGELFVYYTPKKPRLVNHLSRFRLKKGSDEVDPDSEEILMTYKRPFWNHDGGTLAFGPDGFLYIALGDGGAANDPFNNAQNLNTHLGKILRIDVDKKDKDLPYAIPADNPFVGKEKVKPEIWCYGLRNVWRMSFDRETGKLWAADVGQNLWEEINIIERGGNYGWRLREGLHAFGTTGVEPRKDLIDPVWEYHHEIGKSITGGHVYRGKAVPALVGMYLYADYVSGNIWALRYDEKAKRVTANHLIRQGGFPIFSFGEDEAGEVYVLTSTPTGKGIFRFAAK